MLSTTVQKHKNEADIKIPISKRLKYPSQCFFYIFNQFSSISSISHNLCWCTKSFPKRSLMACYSSLWSSPSLTHTPIRKRECRYCGFASLRRLIEKTREVPEELLANPEVKKAVGALEESVFTDAQLAGYEWFWSMISVEKTLYNSAERKGLAAGFEQGKVAEQPGQPHQKFHSCFAGFE